ncbi:MAG TPA: class I SAM-dependent methyltransferase [Candidatus Thermoplasmatota archaeon]|nr:class I SAM-dependent methyltransferase [Candidatus Thermoplasmatota archaeon]
MTNKRLSDSLHTWNHIAKSFNHTRQHTWDFCNDFINTYTTDKICADLGCGNGRHLLPLAVKAKKAFGFDISHNLLAITEKMLKQHQIKNAELVQGDLVHLPFQSNIFDAIIYIAALHNIKQKKNRLQSLKEVNRVLNPGGKALISVWNRDQDRFKQKKFQQQLKEPGDILIYWRQHNLNIPRFYHLYQKQELRDDLEQANFTIQTLKGVNITSKKEFDNFYAIVEKAQ